jgi:endogenous inhibitor of DNA gyrase (YacG/DUF329 family)
MTCPICGKEPSEKYRPFCSRRCSDADLARWLTGSYVIPGPEDEDDLSSEAEYVPCPPDRDRN